MDQKSLKDQLGAEKEAYFAGGDAVLKKYDLAKPSEASFRKLLNKAPTVKKSGPKKAAG